MRRPHNSLKIIFQNKQRRIIKQNDIDNEQILIEIFKKHVHAKKLTAVLTDDHTFKVFQSIYSKFFSNGRFKIIRCMSIVPDVIDPDTQEEIIRNYHEKSNHRGITETFHHLKRAHYFPDMKNKITRIVNNCRICLENKYERNKQPLKFELTETPSKPLDILHIDIYAVHNENFLTIIDKFTKFGSAYILSSRNSINIIKCLKHYFAHHGIPKKLISDNGKEFLSTLFQDFANLYDINLHTTTAKNSTGNSPVERLHSTLTEIIRIIYNQNKRKPISEKMD